MYLLDKYGRRIQFTDIDEQIAGPIKNAVLEATAAPGVAPVLEMVFNALVWADNLVQRFEAANALPKPVACREGCTYCCFNQVELTPLEALLIGDYVTKNFSEDAKTGLRKKLGRFLALKSGKSKRQVAEIRRKLPCPLLQNDKCSVYQVRPLVCRAMHSLDAEKCGREFNSRKTASIEYYLHRYELILSVTAGLKDGCQASGCQDKFLDLSRALADLFGQERPVERWLQGEKVFGAPAQTS